MGIIKNIFSISCGNNAFNIMVITSRLWQIVSSVPTCSNRVIWTTVVCHVGILFLWLFWCKTQSLYYKNIILTIINTQDMWSRCIVKIKSKKIWGSKHSLVRFIGYQYKLNVRNQTKIRLFVDDVMLRKIILILKRYLKIK